MWADEAQLATMIELSKESGKMRESNTDEKTEKDNGEDAESSPFL